MRSNQQYDQQKQVETLHVYKLYNYTHYIDRYTLYMHYSHNLQKYVVDHIVAVAVGVA